MFPLRYWCQRFFTGRYWPKIGGVGGPHLEICKTTVVSRNPSRVVGSLNAERSVVSLNPSRQVKAIC